MTIATKYLNMFNTSTELWSTITGEVAAEHITNQAIVLGEIKSISINALTDATVWFVDGSLITFKKGTWLKRGFYAQVQ